MEESFRYKRLCTATRERSMKKHKVDGHIIHINSIAGHNVPPSSTLNVYPASKFTVTALTESLRFELMEAGSKIKVTSISPGMVETEILNAADMKIPNIESIPALKSKDIADNVIYVLSVPPHVHIREMIVTPQAQN